MDDVVAIVLARGLGRRMREVAKGGPGLTREQASAAASGVKGLVPIEARDGHARPFLDFVLSNLADAGVREVALVIGPEHHALRAQYEGDRRPARVALEFVTQLEARGTADAVRAGERFVAGRPFLSLNADNLYPVECLRALATLDGPGVAGFARDQLVRSSGIPRDRVGTFALLTVAPDGTLVDLVEKPGAAVVEAAGGQALVSMNCWRFDERIFTACRDVPVSARGELELTEAVKLAIRRGVTFRVLSADGPVFDLSRREDIATVTAALAGVEARP